MERDLKFWDGCGELFHVIKCEKVDRVLNKGLKADRSGNISLFVPGGLKAPKRFGKHKGDCGIWVDQCIARELGLTRYSIIGVAPEGIRGEMRTDHTDPKTSRFRYILKQKVIKPEHLAYVDDFIYEGY